MHEELRSEPTYEIKKKFVVSAYEAAYRQIRRSIFFCEYKPGTRLVEEDLAVRLCVSRTPIREALKKLALEGYVCFNANKGAIVNPLNLQEIKDVWLLRSRIEGLAAELAAQRMSEDDLKTLRDALDHVRIADESGDAQTVMQYLTVFDATISKSIEHYQLSCMFGWMQSLSADMRYFVHVARVPTQRSYDLHLLIYEAIARHDVTEARRLTEEHVLGNSEIFIREYLARCNS